MKTYSFTIHTPDVVCTETFTVEAPDYATALDWAQALFHHHVKWWLVSFSDTYVILNDLRRLGHLTRKPLTGIADENGAVVWPDCEKRTRFECAEGVFELESAQVATVNFSFNLSSN